MEIIAHGLWAAAGATAARKSAHVRLRVGTRFLWPVSDYRIDGIPWWTPWFWCCTYAALAIVYFLLWRKGWLTRQS
jgi:hypothetical protein